MRWCTFDIFILAEICAVVVVVAVPMDGNGTRNCNSSTAPSTSSVTRWIKVMCVYGKQDRLRLWSRLCFQNVTLFDILYICIEWINIYKNANADENYVKTRQKTHFDSCVNPDVGNINNKLHEKSSFMFA